MKQLRLSSFLIFGVALVLLALSAQAREPARAESGYQTFDADKCRILLEKTAERLGWPEPEIYVNDYGYEVSCQTSLLGSQDGVPVKIDIQISVQAGWCDDCAYYCESPGNQNNCECVDIHGLPGRLGLAEENQFTTLTFCDPYCELVFWVGALAEDNRRVDPKPVADALYYSALEINCCQVVEAVPPERIQPTQEFDPLDEFNPTEDILPPLPENPPADSTDSAAPLSTSPVTPLIGALIGTLVGWLVSVVATNWSTLKNSFLSSPPPGTLPGTWDEWERNYILPEIPAYRGPDLKENSSVHISVEDARNAVIQFFANDLPSESQKRVANANMRKLDTEGFDAEFLRVFGPKDPDYKFASAFVNPATGEILVCTDREINYTPVHELMHVASNRAFREHTNEAMDEAVTEYFTHKITSARKIVRSSQYDELGSTDVVAEIVRQHGEEILRKAYFQPGDGLNELRQAVDQKLGPGAFAKVVELMGRPYAPPKQMALDLLRGRGIGR